VKRPPYVSALGICTGDIITTSYGTGPYEVWDIQEGTDCIHLVFIDAGVKPRNMDADFRWISNVRRVGDRWFFRGGRDELFVEHRVVDGAQMSLFGAML
jgi:hypothetical protein